MKLGEEKVLEKLRLPPLDPLQATDPTTRRLPSAHWVQVPALLFTLGQAASVLQYLFPPLGGGEGTGSSYATGRNSCNVNMSELDPEGLSKC